jgi:thymidylate synthase (FAD)
MKVIKPSVQLLFPNDVSEIQKVLFNIELAARTCYKSESKMKNTPDIGFIIDKIKKGHLSVIEHGFATVKIICDRGISHEIVRHRIASYSQESTRYCNYTKDKFNNEITFIKPSYLKEGTIDYLVWEKAMQNAEQAYFDLLSLGGTPQEARAVLPNSLKTELIMTANFREWRHFLELRLSKQAHPQMQEIAKMILIELQTIPIIFDDFES